MRFGVVLASRWRWAVPEVPDRTRITIVGGGPAGSLLAYLLHLEGVESVILELRTKEHVLERVRAGVIEHGSAEELRKAGLGERMDKDGFVHEGVRLAFGGRLLRVDFKDLLDKHVVIYGQTELQKDLYDAIETAEITLIDEANDLRLHDIEDESPGVTFTRHGQTHTLLCDFIAGCDGAHSVTRDYIPPSAGKTFERTYPFVWVGVLSETPPVSDEIIYANHETGFALCSMRNENLSRYYVQGSAEDRLDDWPDDRFWETLIQRLPDSVSDRLVTGPSIEKLVTPLRSWVSEPMRRGKLFLAGDAAHVVPPTGAKGLNLAISDVVYLAQAFADHYAKGSTESLDAYSDTALSRVWQAVRFSWWMTNMMHRFPGVSDDFDRRMQLTELEYLERSETARRSLAENYVGLPL
jgi:p-hydroxybenzoate 3-monooxygenase